MLRASHQLEIAGKQDVRTDSPLVVDIGQMLSLHSLHLQPQNSHQLSWFTVAVLRAHPFVSEMAHLLPSGIPKHRMSRMHFNYHEFSGEDR